MASPHSSNSNLTKAQSNSSLKPSDTKSENVLVSVRVRPLAESEVKQNQAHIWDVTPGSAGVINLNQEWAEKLRRTQASDYVYDRVFVGSDNEEIYATAVSEVVRSAMEGFNGTVFAYGPTFSGKTYTMMGDDENPGVIPLAIGEIFEYIRESMGKREFLLRVSYMEIYNETIGDLLAPENKDLKIHEDKHRGTYASPLKEEIVTTPEQVVAVIRRGEENRHVSSTDYNERSSRSHTIFQFIIESRDHVAGSPAMLRVNNSRLKRPGLGGPVRISTLSLIDLAGSEKATSSLERRREGAFINKSLLTLGTVISKLTEDKGGHIPYRDSKLTRILQPALQGNSRVSVICTISPAVNNYEESGNTLKFAQRIKKVVTNASTTEIMDDKALLQKYRSEIDELKNKLTELTEKETESVQLAAEKLRLEEELHQQQLVRTALKERIDHLTKLILTSSSLSGPNFLRSPNMPENIEGAPAARKASNRLSFIPPTLSSPTDFSKLKDELYETQNMLDRVVLENTTLKQSLGEKEAKIADLEAKLAEIKPQIEAPIMDELRMLKDANKKLEAEVALYRKAKAKQDEQNFVDLNDPIALSLTSEKVDLDPDKFVELEHQVDVYKDKVGEMDSENKKLGDTVEKLRRQLEEASRPLPDSIAKNETSPSYSQLYSQYDESPTASRKSQPTSPNTRRSNAQEILSSLLHSEKLQTPPPRRPAPISPPESVVRTENLIKELEWNLEKEKQLREGMESKSIDRIANLETELSIAKTELSVAQLLKYQPPPTAQVDQKSLEQVDKALQELSRSRRSSFRSRGSSFNKDRE